MTDYKRSQMATCLKDVDVKRLLLLSLLERQVNLPMGVFHCYSWVKGEEHVPTYIEALHRIHYKEQAPNWH